MRREPKKKIPIDAPQAGLNPAFARLELASLPAASPALPVEPRSVWKLGHVNLRRELARRGGKTVIVVYDFASHLPLSVIESAAKTLRHSCGCGGAVKGRTIELQGDQPARIRAILEAKGFTVGGIS